MTPPITLSISPEMIDPNPYQPRLAVPDGDVAELAESIRAAGLQSPPRARVHPAAKNRYQLAYGHRRLAAWKLANPGLSMPLVVAEMSDRQMAEAAAVENAHRKELNPVERARAIKRYMDEFTATQAEAGKFFGLSTQGAVSNALRLLNLPEETQALVVENKILEREARPLVPLARFQPKAAAKIAATAAQIGDAEDREDVIRRDIRSVLIRQARNFGAGEWDFKWPAKPIRVETPKAGEPEEVPACAGCEFNLKHDGTAFCTRPACFDLKTRLYADHALERASKRLGIALAGPDEKTSIIYDGTSYDYRADEKARKLVAAKLPALRLVPNKSGRNSYTVKEIFGAYTIALAAVNKAEVEAWLSASAKAKSGKNNVASSGKELTAAQKKKMAEAEEAGRAARRAERAAALKAKHDVSWLVVNSARLIGERISISGGVLALVCETVRVSVSGQYELIAARERELDVDNYRDEAKARELLALKFAADKLPSFKPEYDFDDMQRRISILAGPGNKLEPGFNVKLPAGWDRPPIHQTAFNCWNCGTFAGSDKITKRDAEEGWVVAQIGETVTGVYCPKCNDVGKKRKKK